MRAPARCPNAGDRGRCRAAWGSLPCGNRIAGAFATWMTPARRCASRLPLLPYSRCLRPPLRECCRRPIARRPGPASSHGEAAGRAAKSPRSRPLAAPARRTPRRPAPWTLPTVRRAAPKALRVVREIGVSTGWLLFNNRLALFELKRAPGPEGQRAKAASDDVERRNSFTEFTGASAKRPAGTSKRPGPTRKCLFAFPSPRDCLEAAERSWLRRELRKPKRPLRPERPAANPGGQSERCRWYPRQRRPANCAVFCLLPARAPCARRDEEP